MRPTKNQVPAPPAAMIRDAAGTPNTARYNRYAINANAKPPCTTDAARNRPAHLLCPAIEPPPDFGGAIEGLDITLTSISRGTGCSPGNRHEHSRNSSKVPMARASTSAARNCCESRPTSSPTDRNANAFTATDLSPTGDSDAVCNESDPRRAGARPPDGGSARPDLPNVHIQPEGATGLGVRPDGEPDAIGAGAEPRGARGGQARALLQLGDGGHHDHPHSPQERRSRRRER